MSKNVAMFVDVANMYYAARGQDVDVDYVALLKHATKGRDLIRAYAYTGLDPENENQRKFIDFLAKNGYRPVVKDIRKFGDGRMKANLDIELVVDLFRLADRMDIAVIVSGDGDFAPAIRALQDKGVRCEVISFKPNTSSDLVAVADEFEDIMKIASIGRRKAGEAAGAAVSTPEMPAKEVTPEFGFREASPSVAAAALAALRGGTAGGDGRRGRAATTRRSPRTRAAAAAQAPAELPPGELVATEADAAAETDEQARRRRRRRGGRGRGRARREEGAPEVAAEPVSEEIGWQEFDDLSQLDLGEEREIAIEEADAATLAELGLTPEDVGQAAPDAAADELAPKPPRGGRASRGTSAKKPDADARKPRRRTTRSKAGGDDDGDGAGAGEAGAGEAGAGDDKPTPRRRGGRAKKPAAEAPPGESGASSEPAATESDAEAQGIWSRFRSGRRPRTAS